MALHKHKCQHCHKVFEHNNSPSPEEEHKCVLCGKPTHKWIYTPFYDGKDGDSNGRNCIVDPVVPPAG